MIDHAALENAEKLLAELNRRAEVGELSEADQTQRQSLARQVLRFQDPSNYSDDWVVSNPIQPSGPPPITKGKIN